MKPRPQLHRHAEWREDRGTNRKRRKETKLGDSEACDQNQSAELLYEQSVDRLQLNSITVRKGSLFTSLVHNQIKGVWVSLDSIFKGRTYDDVDEYSQSSRT